LNANRVASTYGKLTPEKLGSLARSPSTHRIGANEQAKRDGHDADQGEGERKDAENHPQWITSDSGGASSLAKGHWD
jgi:hypothetical protein